MFALAGAASGLLGAASGGGGGGMGAPPLSPDNISQKTENRVTTGGVNFGVSAGNNIAMYVGIGAAVLVALVVLLKK